MSESNVTTIPPYRSLVNPSMTYDYETHKVIHLTPQEMKSIFDSFSTASVQKPKTVFRMKYRSLLSDVSMKASKLSRKVSSLKQPSQPSQTLISETTHKVQKSGMCNSFRHLPVEIQITIFSYVNDAESYKNCLYANRLFHQLAKPYFLRSIAFTSTYRFAQFVTCLRISSTLGLYVEEIDLSGIRPGNADVELNLERLDSVYALSDPDDFNAYVSQVLAGWRDWKFKNNLYSLHPVAIPLSKSQTNLTQTAQNSVPSKRIKLTKYFKRRRSSSNVVAAIPVPDRVKTQNSTPKPVLVSSSHPKTNRFLSNYASSKDIPVGSLLHVINMCPNLRSLNLSNITLSTDYRVKRPFQALYPRYDLVNNYPKELFKTTESLFPQVQVNSFFSGSSHGDMASSASSVFSIATFKPILKYNSLLPPVDLVSPEMHYANKGDSHLFLSDLSLKSISTLHLEIIQPKEIFACLERRRNTLEYLNMSSMIWLNLKIVRGFLRSLLAADLSQKFVDGKERTAFRNETFKVGGRRPDIYTTNSSTGSLPELVFDLTNSGMSKSLPWAQNIDTREWAGRRLVYRIVNDEVLSVSQENIIRERHRRGRAGENYFV